MCAVLFASGVAWAALSLPVVVVTVGDGMQVLRDALANCLVLLAVAALAASTLASQIKTVGRPLMRPLVLILALHAPIGSLICLFVLVAILGDRRDDTPPRP